MGQLIKGQVLLSVSQRRVTSWRSCSVVVVVVVATVLAAVGELPELDGETDEPYQPNIKNNNNKSTVPHEYTQLHLKRVQSVADGYFK